MKKLNTIVLFFLFTVTSIVAKNDFSISPIFNPFTQGGVLEFSSNFVERYEMSLQNSDSLVLRNYSGLPLKALQFKILVGKNGGRLKFKSLTRGTGIPASSFLLDYQVNYGELQTDGSSADVVSVVLLGLGENALSPAELHHIISINYEVVSLEGDSILTSISLSDVIGATDAPIQNANITAGKDEIIYLRKSSGIITEKILLLQNYPNPFNPSTTIQFFIPNKSFTKLEIYNSIGERVSTLLSETLMGGIHNFEWNAEGLPSGIYFSKLEAGNLISTRKMLMIK